MIRHIALRLTALLVACSLIALFSRAEEPKQVARPATPNKRIPWTTSKITGSPEPPPKYMSVRVFPQVKFQRPLLIARCPGTERLFVGEQNGKLFSLAPGATQPDLFCDLEKELETVKRTPGSKIIDIFYGLEFHPRFAENRLCYLCYTIRDPKVPFPPEGTRVSRFKVTKDDPPRLDMASEEIIITFQGGGHNGGDIHFGPDGMLYISSGDGRGPNPPDPLNTGQDCSDLLASILRINVEHRDEGRNYAIPRDNPFVGMKGVRPEIWAFGFRNPYRMSFDRQTGDLWVGDVGWELWEMVQKVQKGGNYGWSIVEGKQPTKPSQKIGPTPILPPTIELPHTIAASVTGGYVYRGKKFPELVGTYIFGDWETRRMWSARFENGRLKEMPEIVKPNIRIVAYGEDNVGELYYLDYDTGFMYTLERNDATAANNKFPTRLSDTGLFASVKDYTPQPGVLPFTPAVAQWQDGMVSLHHVAVPNDSSVLHFDKPRRIPGQVYWHDFHMQFPRDAVLVKTIHLPGSAAEPKVPGNRIETQVLHFDGEDCHGYTYAWRDDQSDADLVPADGAEKLVQVPDARFPGGKLEQNWTFHGRNQCMVCHSAWSEYSLAFNAGQLNNGNGEETNELVEFTRQGLIQRVGKDDEKLPPFDEVSVKKEVSFLSGRRPGDLKSILTAAERDTAARAYLHVNCSHCHRFGGGGGQVVLEMDFSRPLKETGLLDVVPKQGDFGLPNARLIKPGDPYSSVLYYRMAKFGRGRMPHMGSEFPDPRGLRLIGDWITDLGGKHPGEPVLAPVDVEKRLRSLHAALPLADVVAHPRSRGDRELARKVIEDAARLEPGPVRDLFEGYLPPDPRGRTLGPNPRPASILSLKGDAAKGESIFYAKEMKCASCHKVGERGTALGPDLSLIGKNRTREELLESLLQPSLRIEPQFATYLVQTRDEKTVTGLLIKRDDKQLVLRDADNKEIVLAAHNVESVRPSRLSLMPDGQMNGLRPQEAADLLEYLVQRK